jgi:hypothetical protein
VGSPEKSPCGIERPNSTFDRGRVAAWIDLTATISSHYNTLAAFFQRESSEFGSNPFVAWQKANTPAFEDEGGEHEPISKKRRRLGAMMEVSATNHGPEPSCSTAKGHSHYFVMS